MDSLQGDQDLSAQLTGSLRSRLSEGSTKS